MSVFIYVCNLTVVITLLIITLPGEAPYKKRFVRSGIAGSIRHIFTWLTLIVVLNLLFTIIQWIFLTSIDYCPPFILVIFDPNKGLFNRVYNVFYDDMDNILWQMEQCITFLVICTPCRYILALISVNQNLFLFGNTTKKKKHNNHHTHHKNKRQRTVTTFELFEKKVTSHILQSWSPLPSEFLFFTKLFEFFANIKTHKAYNVRRDQPSLIITNHALGHLFDVPMMVYLLYKNCGIIPRVLVSPLHFNIPIWSSIILKLGGAPRTRESCEVLMSKGESILVYASHREYDARDNSTNMVWDNKRKLYLDLVHKYNYNVIPAVCVSNEEVLEIVYNINDNPNGTSGSANRTTGGGSRNMLQKNFMKSMRNISNIGKQMNKRDSKKFNNNNTFGANNNLYYYSNTNGQNNFVYRKAHTKHNVSFRSLRTMTQPLFGKHLTNEVWERKLYHLHFGEPIFVPYDEIKYELIKNYRSNQELVIVPAKAVHKLSRHDRKKSKKSRRNVMNALEAEEEAAQQRMDDADMQSNANNSQRTPNYSSKSRQVEDVVKSIMQAKKRSKSIRHSADIPELLDDTSDDRGLLEKAHSARVTSQNDFENEEKDYFGFDNDMVSNNNMNNSINNNVDEMKEIEHANELSIAETRPRRWTTIEQSTNSKAAQQGISNASGGNKSARGRSKSRRDRSKSKHSKKRSAVIKDNVDNNNYDNSEEEMNSILKDSPKLKRRWSRELEIRLKNAVEEAMTDGIVSMYEEIRANPDSQLMKTVQDKLRHLSRSMSTAGDGGVSSFLESSEDDTDVSNDTYQSYQSNETNNTNKAQNDLYAD